MIEPWEMKLRLSNNPYLALVFFVSIYIFTTVVFGYGVVRIIKVISADHEYTKGFPIEFSGSKGETVSYIYNVKGKKYSAKMRTAIFFRRRKLYTVVYMQKNPNISFLKEHAVAVMIQNMIFLIFFNITILFAIYCIVKKRILRK